MALKANFKPNAVQERLEAVLRVIEKRQIQRLQYLGEMCVKHARENGSYTDQTGNLRSSIGYVVYKDGIEVSSGFEKFKDGTEGGRQGKGVADWVAMNHTEGILLVVVAGMNYALKVESKGRDVLTSAELLAEKELPKMLEQLTDNIIKAFA